MSSLIVSHDLHIMMMELAVEKVNNLNKCDLITFLQ